MRTSLLLLVLAAGALATALAPLPARGDEDVPAPAPGKVPGKAPGAATEGAPDAVQEPVSFGDDYAAALVEARETNRPLLLVAVPDWYESPAVRRLREEVLVGEASRNGLAGYVRVMVEESPDREVHVRHRLKVRGYPLAVVLATDGTYLGSLAGLPREDAVARWPERVASIPDRHRRKEALRARLRTDGEDAVTLLELATMLHEEDEPARADALLERLEAADPTDRSTTLGEARYLRLRIAAAAAFPARGFADVEAPCLRWLRRFPDHARLPDVLGLQADARFLAGRKDEAREVWRLLVKEHAGTPAADRAQKALDALTD